MLSIITLSNEYRHAGPTCLNIFNIDRSALHIQHTKQINHFIFTTCSFFIVLTPLSPRVHDAKISLDQILNRRLVDADYQYPLLMIENTINARLQVDTPFISLGLSDTRGLKNAPTINWDGRSYEFQQNSQLNYFKQGLHAPLEKLDFSTMKKVDFEFNFSIDGIEQFALIPIAKNNQISLRSKWQHPQFFGRFLPSPKERKIDANGFNATWNISSLSSDAQQQFLATQCCQSAERPVEKSINASADGGLAAAQNAAQNLGQIDSFGVAFIEPVNISC